MEKKEVSPELYKQIGLRIRDIRKRRGLTQWELARKCEMEPSNLNRIEAGRTNPTVRSLAVIAVALEVNLMDFLVDAKIKVLN